MYSELPKVMENKRDSRRTLQSWQGNRLTLAPCANTLVGPCQTNTDTDLPPTASQLFDYAHNYVLLVPKLCKHHMQPYTLCLHATKGHLSVLLRHSRLAPCGPSPPQRAQCQSSSQSLLLPKNCSSLPRPGSQSAIVRFMYLYDDRIYT